MTRGQAFLTVLILLSGCAVASAQEKAGAGKMEAGGFPGGGALFVSGDDNLEVNFNNYTFGLFTGYNVNRMLGVEGEFGIGLGLAQDLNYKHGVVRHVQVPHTWEYSGNVVVYPGGNDRRFAGYVTGGAGGLTLTNRPSTAQFGLTKKESFFATNVGAGLKIYRGDNWGYRIDYRIFAVGSKDSAAAFFARSKTRLGHRFYVGLLYSRR